jgi:hypothetical protein
MFSEPPRSHKTQRSETNLHIKICPVGHARLSGNWVQKSVTNAVSEEIKRRVTWHHGIGSGRTPTSKAIC